MPEHDEVSAILRRLRKSAGLTGTEAARQAGVSQPSISRWEAGRNVPGLGDVRALCRVYNAPPADRRALERAVRDLRESPNPPARVTMRRAGEMQKRITRVQAGSALIRSFQPIIIHGTLQTPAYARAVFTSGGDMPADQVDAAVEERMLQGEAIREGATRLVAVLAEGALRWPMGSLEVMAEQIEHLVEASRHRNIDLGVVPSTRPVEVAATHTFDVLDDRAALVGTETVTAFLTDPRDVEAYVKLFEDIRRFADFGDDARAVLDAAATRYRG